MPHFSSSQVEQLQAGGLLRGRDLEVGCYENVENHD